jgi:hypothetical protein
LGYFQKSLRDCWFAQSQEAGLKICAALLALFITSAAMAHDPYEITSTLSLYTNRAELQVELEFRAGMLLAGQAENGEASEQFGKLRPKLNEVTRRFFRLAINGAEVQPARSEASLGVENHLHFEILFPAITNGACSVEAPGLNALAEQGPYGVSLTVLDMVNRKVLGQSVLFAGTPVAQFKVPERGKETAEVIHLPKAAASKETVKTVNKDSASPGTPLKRGVNQSVSIALWTFAALLGIAGICWAKFRRGRKEKAAW